MPGRVVFWFSKEAGKGIAMATAAVIAAATSAAIAAASFKVGEHYGKKKKKEDKDESHS